MLGISLYGVLAAFFFPFIHFRLDLSLYTLKAARPWPMDDRRGVRARGISDLNYSRNSDKPIQSLTSLRITTNDFALDLSYRKTDSLHVQPTGWLRRDAESQKIVRFPHEVTVFLELYLASYPIYPITLWSTLILIIISWIQTRVKVI